MPWQHARQSFRQPGGSFSSAAPFAGFACRLHAVRPLLLRLVDQGLVDVRDDAAARNCCLHAARPVQTCCLVWQCPQTYASKQSRCQMSSGARMHRDVGEAGQLRRPASAALALLCLGLLPEVQTRCRRAHTLMSVSSSSSPRMASCRCRGVMRFTCIGRGAAC